MRAPRQSSCSARRSSPAAGDRGWTCSGRQATLGRVTKPDELLALMPFAAQLGVVLDHVGPQETVGRLAWSPERCTAGGVLHGGALMSLADWVGAICAYLNL